MEKGQPLQQMMLVQLAVSMQKNENRPFLVLLYKAQMYKQIKDLHIDQFRFIDLSAYLSLYKYYAVLNTIAL